MSYHKHKTHAIVLAHTPHGEHDRVYTLFTRDHGLLRATAKSIRREDSRLRATLLPHSELVVDLVRGRAVWRITSGTHVAHLLAVSPQVRMLVARYDRLLARFVAHESRVDELFDEAIYIRQILRTQGAIAAPAYEVIALTRLLSRLGYWGEYTDVPWLSGDVLPEYVTMEQGMHRELVPAINNALRNTQLMF